MTDDNGERDEEDEGSSVAQFHTAIPEEVDLEEGHKTPGSVGPGPGVAPWSHSIRFDSVIPSAHEHK